MKPDLTHRVNPLNGKPLPPRRGRGARRAPMPATDARAVLEANANGTQAALDEYLATVANPRVLGPLRVARDGAREALAAFNKHGGQDR